MGCCQRPPILSKFLHLKSIFPIHGNGISDISQWWHCCVMTQTDDAHHFFLMYENDSMWVWSAKQRENFCVFVFIFLPLMWCVGLMDPPCWTMVDERLRFAWQGLPLGRRCGWHFARLQVTNTSKGHPVAPTLGCEEPHLLCVVPSEKVRFASTPSTRRQPGGGNTCFCIFFCVFFCFACILF